MKLGTKGRYAVMALVDLTMNSQGQPVVLADVAGRQNLPSSYLEQLFARLRKSDLVKSIRGQSGGYLLSKDPSEITISDIFRAVDEPIRTTACNPKDNLGCGGKRDHCLTHHLWAGLSDVMDDYLTQITLAHVCGLSERGQA